MSRSVDDAVNAARALGSLLRTRLEHTAGKLGQDRLLVILLVTLVLVRAIYILTYPFYIEGDGYTYYELILAFRSNLLHATGYVFFAQIPRLLAGLLGKELAGLLVYVQQGVSIASVAALYLALRRIVARWNSFIICLPLGVDTQLVAASGTTRPEFLQSDILMLLVSSAIFGLTSANTRTKGLFYVVTGCLIAAGYVTKYNFLPALIFGLVPLFDRRLEWQKSFRMLVYSIGGALLLLAVFLAGFHYPTTGTFQLNLEHGWIHMLKLQEASIPILPANGIATQKYTFLSDHLPTVIPGPGLWNKIDEIPDTVRAPYRQNWAPLLASRDGAFVRTLVSESTSPEQRRTSYYDPVAFYTLYYHLGLHEGEGLLRAVFWESVRAYPRRYLSNIWQCLLQGTDFSASYLPYLPVPKVFAPPLFFEHPTAPILPVRVRVFKSVDLSLMRPEDLAAQIWLPGARFFSYLATMKYFPSGVFWLIVIAGFAVLSFSVVRHRRLQSMEVLFILTTIVLLGEIGLSAVVFVFRMKELILCEPLIYLATGLAIALITERVAPNAAGFRQSHRLS